MAFELFVKENTVIVAGRGSEDLAEKIGDRLGLHVMKEGPESKIKVAAGEYPDSEFFADFGEEERNNVRGKSVIFIGPRMHPPKVKAADVVMEYVMIGDALSRSSAGHFNYFIPYLPGLRDERTKGKRRANAAKAIIDTISLYNPNNILIVEPHEERIEGFFPRGQHPSFLWMTNLYANHISSLVKETNIPPERVVSVAVDHGTLVRVGQLIDLTRNIYHADISPEFGIAEKKRLGPGQSEIMSFSGAELLKDSLAILPDDIIASGGTLVQSAKATKKAGALAAIGIMAHPILNKDEANGLPKVLKELNKPDSALDGLILTNTLNIPKEIREHPRVWVLDISEYAAIAMHNAWMAHDRASPKEGSLRAYNQGQREILTPQPVPPAFRDILVNKFHLALAS